MLKYILLATSVAIASPALAQEAPAADKTATPQQTPAPDQSAPPPAETATPAPDAQPATAQTAPTPETQPATAAAQPTPAQPAPAEPVSAAAAAPAAAQPATAAATPAPAQPATSANQVAQVVGQEFSTYDKDSSGALDKAEFGAWMAALRKASEPAFNADSPEGQTWVTQAFAQADTDKNSTITQGELTTFLSPKPA